MKLADYEDLRYQLRSLKDVDRLAHERHLSRDMLFLMLEQNLTKKTIRTFHQVKARSRQLHKDWLSGISLLTLARENGIAPVLLAGFVLGEMGHSKKEIRKFIVEVHTIKNQRVRAEMEEAIRHDYIYSEWAHQEQKARGIFHEDKIANWLKPRGAVFKTEKDQKVKGPRVGKTPDFLLDKPLEINGKKLYWLESKALFGSPYEMKRIWAKQISHYVSLFGPGLIVYWFGFVEDVPEANPKDILVVDHRFFEPHKIHPDELNYPGKPLATSGMNRRTPQAPPQSRPRTMP